MTAFSLISGSDADDFEPPKELPKIPIAKLDKWEGEDEEDDVKDAWDKSDSDESGDSTTDPDRPKAVQRKKKKKLAEIIAEKEAAKAAQMAARAAEEQAKRQLNTPEAKNVEKMRLKKMEETSNLQLAQEMMGKTDQWIGPDGALQKKPNDMGLGGLVGIGLLWLG